MYLLYTASNLYYKKKYTDMLNKKSLVNVFLVVSKEYVIAD